MKITFHYLYRNKTVQRLMTVDDVIEKIRKKAYDKDVAILRANVTYAVQNNITDRLVNDLDIPSVCWTVGDGGYTGLVCVSLPFGTDTALRDRLRRTVNAMQQVRCSFVGSSGLSLKVVMAYTPKDGDLCSLRTETEIADFHKAAYLNARNFLWQVTGVKSNDNGGNWQRGLLMSCDEEAFCNPDSTVIILPDTQRGMPDIDFDREPVYDASLLPDYNTLQMEVTKFNIVCRQLGMDSNGCIDERVLTLAEKCRQYGITEEVAVKCTLAMSEEWRSHEMLVRTSFENAYQKDTPYHSEVMSRPLMNQMLLRDFLKKRFLFRRNEITDNNEFMERNKYLSDWRPIDQITLNTICMAAHSAGISVWDKDIRRYVESEFCNDYNPVTEWLARLPDWDGTDRISQVAEMVSTDTPAWKELFGVWFRGMVHQWIKGNSVYGASLVMMLIGGQGTGKSTFCKRLIPESLRSYYNDRLDLSNRKEADRSLMRFLLICLDEYDQINPRQVAVLKNVIQKNDVMYRRMFQEDTAQRHRYAAFCATTNSPTPLTDPTGSRRFLCVNVTGGIDTETEIDYEQLYAQAVTELRSGAAYYLNKEEERTMQEYNGRFYMELPLESMISQYVRMPDGNEVPLEVTALELLQLLKDRTKIIPINASCIKKAGIILSQSGYKKKRMAKGWVYQVVIVSDSK